MAHLALLTLLGLVSKHCDLLCLAVLQHFAGNGCTLNIGLADLQAVLAANSDNLEINGGVLFCCKLLDLDNVAILYFVLLAASFNNCKHESKALPFL